MSNLLLKGFGNLGFKYTDYSSGLGVKKGWTFANTVSSVTLEAEVKSAEAMAYSEEGMLGLVTAAQNEESAMLTIESKALEYASLQLALNTRAEVESTAMEAIETMDLSEVVTRSLIQSINIPVSGVNVPSVSNMFLTNEDGLSLTFSTVAPIADSTFQFTAATTGPIVPASITIAAGDKAVWKLQYVYVLVNSVIKFGSGQKFGNMGFAGIFKGESSYGREDYEIIIPSMSFSPKATLKSGDNTLSSIGKCIRQPNQLYFKLVRRIGGINSVLATV